MAAAFVGGRTVQVGWLGVRDGGHQVLRLQKSSNEPGELSQWLCHNDCTTNITELLLLLLLLLTVKLKRTGKLFLEQKVNKH